MPLFFFLSGFVSFITIKIDSYKTLPFYIKNKAISLLIPMLSWTFIRKYFFYTHDYSISNFKSIFIQELLNPRLWFLQILFFIYLIYSFYYLLSKSFNRESKIGIDLLLLLLTILILGFISFLFKNYSIITFLLNYSYFMMGVFLSKFISLKKLIDNKLIASLIFLIFLLIVGHYNFKQSELIIMKCLKVFISITAIISFYYIFKNLNLPNWLDLFFSKLGQKSLIIYVTHFSFIPLFSSIILIPNNISVPFLLIILIPSSVIVIFFSMVIGKIVSIFPFLNFIFYGVQLNKISK